MLALTIMLDLIPKFDGQTVASIVIGAAISVVTFWLGYRRTVGAQEERVRIANSEIISTLGRELINRIPKALLV
jgi:hypothetical protein